MFVKIKNMIHLLIEKIDPSQLLAYFWWFTILSIILPIIGAILGGMFVIASVKVNDRITDRKQKENEIRLAASETTAAEVTAKLLIAQKKLDESATNLRQLEESQRPRIITSEQRDAFRSAIGDTPRSDTIGVYTAGNDTEAAQYATQLRTMLQENGFNAGKMNGIAFGANYPKGVTIVIKNLTNPPLSAKGLGEAMVTIDPTIKRVAYPDIKLTEEILILVGQKP